MKGNIILHVIEEAQNGTVAKRFLDTVPAYLATFGGTVEVVATCRLRRIRHGEHAACITAAEIRHDGEIATAIGPRLARLERFLKTTAKDAGVDREGVCFEIHLVDDDAAASAGG